MKTAKYYFYRCLIGNYRNEMNQLKITDVSQYKDILLKDNYNLNMQMAEIELYS